MPDQNHGLLEYIDGSVDCTCGQWFEDGWAALNHSLPILTRDLADARAADPQSTLAQVVRSESLAQRTARVCKGVTDA